MKRHTAAEARRLKVKAIVDRYVETEWIDPRSLEVEKASAMEFTTLVVETLAEPFTVADVVVCVRRALDWPDHQAPSWGPTRGSQGFQHRVDPFQIEPLVREVMREMLSQSLIAATGETSGARGRGRRVLYVRIPGLKVAP